MKKLLDTIKGWDVPPVLVATARGILEAALLAGLNVLVLNTDDVLKLVPDMSPANLAALNIAALWLLRQVEGIIDETIDPNQNRGAEARAKNP